ncbi:MAG: histidine kinase [Balneolaceae bacterium]
MKALKISGLWIGVAFLISSITFLNQIQENYSENLSVLNVLLFETVCISPWAVSTPFIVRIARRFRFEEGQRLTSAVVHFLVALAVFSFHTIIQSLTVTWFYHDPVSLSYMWLDFRGFLDMRLMLYTGLLLGIYAIDFQKRNREIELREPRLKAQLNRAKYRAMINQIQPDFLIDSIESIERNIADDPERAEHVLIDLSDLLRIMLKNIEREEVSIQEDLESFHLYVEILRNRLDTDIREKTDISPDCYHARIPSFLLLVPFLEKVIEKTPDTGSIKSISYKAERVGNEVHLEASIDGVPTTSEVLDKEQKRRLANILTRLKDKFDDDSVKLTTEAKDSKIFIYFHIPFHGIKEDPEAVLTGFEDYETTNVIRES